MNKQKLFLKLLKNINLEALKTKIETQASYYIPNIRVLDVVISESEDRHTIFITIMYQSTLDGTQDAIKLNFK